MRLCLGLSVSTQQVGLLTRYRDRKAYPYTHAHPLHTSDNTQPSFPLNPVRSPPPSLSFLTFSTNLKVSFFEQTNSLSFASRLWGYDSAFSFLGPSGEARRGKGQQVLKPNLPSLSRLLPGLLVRNGDGPCLEPYPRTVA